MLVTERESFANNLSSTGGIGAVDESSLPNGEFTANTMTAGNQGDPSVVALSSGGTVVFWESASGDGSSGAILGQFFDASGAKVGDEFLVNSRTENSQLNPAAVELEDGTIVVTWLSFTGSRIFDIAGQLLTADGEKVGEEFIINEAPTSGVSSTPGLTALDDGGFMVAWSGDGLDNDEEGVVGRIYDADGNAVTDAFQINQRGEDDQYGPQLTTLADGNVVATWVSLDQINDTTSPSISARIFDPQGNALGNEIPVYSGDGAQYWPDVAALSDGGFAIVWQNSSSSIYARVFDADGDARTYPIIVDGTTSYSRGLATIKATDDGGFIIVWGSDFAVAGGISDGVFLRQYDADGEALNDAFQVSLRAASRFTYADIAVAANGDLMVVWGSAITPSDDSGRGISYRFLSPDDDGLYDWNRQDMNGSAQPDTLYGSDQADLIEGNDGNDSLRGDDGDDTISGGTGNDSLLGGGGDDMLSGGTGNDRLIGNEGDDVLTGGDGNDSLVGHAGADTMLGGAGNDVVLPGDGDSGGDYIDGAEGNDTLNGGAGDDVIIGGSGADSIIGDFGNDSLYAHGVDVATDTSGDYLSGGRGADLIVGAAGDDTLDGGKENDTLIGGAGDDLLIGLDDGVEDRFVFGSGWGNDTITSFETAEDLLDFSAVADSLDDLTIEDTDDGVLISDGSGNTVLLEQISSDALSSDNFFFSASPTMGSDGDDTLLGDVGNDTLDGGAGDDLITGGTGNDLLSGGTGNDTLQGGGANDQLRGGFGNDRMQGDGGNDVLYGDVGNDTLDGGLGNDTASYFESAAAVSVDLSTGGLTGQAKGDVYIDIEHVTGSKRSDVITGDDNDNRIKGMDGWDTLNGAGGNDTIEAGGGHDVVDGGDGDDLITGGGRRDDLMGGKGADTIDGGPGDDTLAGGSGDDILTGGAHKDTFVFESGSGNDQVTDFQVGLDVLDLSGTATDFTDLAGVIAVSTETIEGLLINLGGGDSVLLAGIWLDDLDNVEIDF